MTANANSVPLPPLVLISDPKATQVIKPPHLAVLAALD